MNVFLNFKNAKDSVYIMNVFEILYNCFKQGIRHVSFVVRKTDNMKHINWILCISGSWEIVICSKICIYAITTYKKHISFLETQETQDLSFVISSQSKFRVCCAFFALVFCGCSPTGGLLWYFKTLPLLEDIINKYSNGYRHVIKDLRYYIEFDGPRSEKYFK